MKEKMLQEFKRVYGEDRDVKVYFAPGRVNLIGEHTDYNGGHVFPCALTMPGGQRRIYVAAGRAV